MSLLDTIGLILLSGVVGVALFVLMMALGAVAEWLVMKVKGHAAHR